MLMPVVLPQAPYIEESAAKQYIDAEQAWYAQPGMKLR
jgi:hypothetical protein